jgi:hypothetical protein
MNASLWIDAQLRTLLMRGRILPAALVLFGVTALFCGASRLMHGVALNWLHCALPWAAVVTLPWIAAWAWARRGWRPSAFWGRSSSPWTWAALLAGAAWAGRLLLEALLLDFDLHTATRNSLGSLPNLPVATLAYAMVLQWRDPPAPAAPAPAPAPASAAALPQRPPPDLLELPQSDGGRLRLAWAEVEAVHTAGNYVELSVKGRRHLLRATMADTEALLAARPDTHFVRIHRSVLVNLAAVQGLVGPSSAASGHSFVLMRDGSQQPVSRRRMGELQAAWQRYRVCAAGE